MKLDFLWNTKTFNVVKKHCNVVNDIVNAVRNVVNVVNNVANVVSNVVNMDCSFLCAFLSPKHSPCDFFVQNHCQMLPKMLKCCENVAMLPKML